MTDRRVEKDNNSWAEALSPEEFRICRQKGTERAFTGEYWDCKTRGIYRCRCCGEPLFDSESKYDSGSGWPSFFEPKSKASIVCETDQSLGMSRTEILCRVCDSHLGHVFPDGPAPSGERYCVNSASLELIPDDVDSND